MPFFIFFLIFMVTGCVSHYRDQLQDELDLHNAEVIDRMEMGEITQTVAEQQIEEELKAKRELLVGYKTNHEENMEIVWAGFSTALKIGLTIAGSYLGGAPDLYRVGDLAIQSLRAQMTVYESDSLPPKTFTLPPNFHHLYDSIQSHDQPCPPKSVLCQVRHLQMFPETP